MGGRTILLTGQTPRAQAKPMLTVVGPDKLRYSKNPAYHECQLEIAKPMGVVNSRNSMAIPHRLTRGCLDENSLRYSKNSNQASQMAMRTTNALAIFKEPTNPHAIYEYVSQHNINTTPTTYVNKPV